MLTAKLGLYQDLTMCGGRDCSKIITGSATAPTLATGSVGATQIVAGSVGATQLGANVVGNGQLAPLSAPSELIGSNSASPNATNISLGSGFSVANNQTI